jgi:hypothetical protein
VAELITVAQDWIALGAPGLDRYQVSFQPGDPSLPGLLSTGRSHESAGPWQVQRINHVETVTLDPK